MLYNDKCVHASWSYEVNKIFMNMLCKVSYRILRREGEGWREGGREGGKKGGREGGES